MEHKKLECYKCKKLLADNLVQPNGLCVYCAADEADQLPQPKKQPKTPDKQQIRASKLVSQHKNIQGNQLIQIAQLSNLLPISTVTLTLRHCYPGDVQRDMMQKISQFLVS